MVVLLPGAVSVTDETGGPPYWPESFMVGAPPQWADGSDATYSQSAIGITSVPAIHNDHASAPLDQLIGDPAAVTDIITRVRASGDMPDPLGDELGLSVFVGDPSGGYTDLFGIWAMVAGAPPSDHELSVRDLAAMFGADPDMLVVAYATALALPGQHAVLSVAGTYDVSGPVVGQVYELSIEVLLPGGRARPVRMYPRHDGRNLSSAPRVVGGYQ